MNSHYAAGFTLVEIIITTVLASLLMIALTQAVFGATSQQRSIERYSIADSIAQNNLRKFYASSDTGATCSIAHPATSIEILGARAEPAPKGNFVNFTQSVTIQWPYGCDRSPLLESIISYGPTLSREVITHAKYAR